MAITKDSVLVVYNINDADSEALALYYVDVHGLSLSQLYGIDLTESGIYASKALFDSEFSDLITVLAADATYKAVVLCMGVGTGFVDGSDVISSTSYFCHPGIPYSAKQDNPIYDRSSSKRLSETDITSYRLVSRIDGPTLEYCKSVVDNGIKVSSQRIVNGKINFDPFPAIDIEDVEAQNYADDLDDFVTNGISDLKIGAVFTASPESPLTDNVIPFLQDDSFYWGCNGDNVTSSFFRPTASARVFLYNADSQSSYGGAADLSISSTLWPYVALLNGYACCGSSLAAPLADQWLRPKPFFESLRSGAFVGEAYLFALPQLDSPEVLLGDPLVFVSFPGVEAPSTQYSAAVGTSLAIDRFSQAITCLYRKKTLANIVKTTALSQANPADLSLLKLPAGVLGASFDFSYLNDLTTLASQCFLLLFGNESFPTTRTVNSYLSANEVKVGSIYSEALAELNISIDAGNLYSTGQWFLDKQIVDEAGLLQSVSYHFEYDIATDDAFSDVVSSGDSEASQVGWTYENDSGEFVSVTASGVPSRYVGRLVRYSGTGLTKGLVYHARLRQKDSVTSYDWQTFRLAVYT